MSEIYYQSEAYYSSLNDCLRLLRDGMMNELVNTARDGYARSRDVMARTDFAKCMYVGGQRDSALNMLEETMKLIPGHAYPATQRGIILLGECFPEVPVQRPAAKSQPFIQMQTLGANGRFGNQLNQYAFARVVALNQGLELRTPNWIGRYLFDLDDPDVGPFTRTINEQDIDLSCALAGVGTTSGLISSLEEYNIWGYYPMSGFTLRSYRRIYQSLYQPAPWIESITHGILAKLRAIGQTIVALHLRRGDMVTDDTYWVAPVSWYRTQLAEIWQSLETPVLYIASEDPEIRLQFLDYPVVTCNELLPLVPGAEFYTDWFVMSQADLLLISNSSFSYTAALTNRVASRFYRPSRLDQRLYQFDPWAECQLIEMPG